MRRKERSFFFFPVASRKHKHLKEQVGPHVMSGLLTARLFPSPLTTSSWGFQHQTQGEAQPGVKYSKAPTQGKCVGRARVEGV